LSVFAGVTNPGNDPHVAGTVIGYAVSTGAISVGAASDFGADGPGTTTTYALAVSAQGVDSGLNLTDGTSVFLFLEDGLVVGRAGTDATDAADNPAAFALAIDATTGQVSMVQYLSLQHPNPSNPDESISITNGAVLATATVTDGDNDPATGSLAIGSLISFQDDAPDAQVADVATDTLVLDETIPVGTETDGDSDPVGRTTITADFSNNFATTINYGADGPAASGNVSYSLVLTGTNVASGLYALDPTDTTVGDGDGIGRGTQIVLNQSGNTITGTANGQTYFTISINPSTGVVTFTQNIPIWHANTGSDDDTSTLSAVANSLVVRQTVTDGDGDSDTADIDLSNGIFQIEDDGPVANPDTDTVASGTATGNVITDLAAGDSGDSDSGADDVGADTPGRVSLIDNGSVPGPALEVPAGGSVTIDGAYGTLQIFSNGNYTYTRTDGLGGGQSETFTYTLMDADGDTTTSTLTIAIPDATPVLATPPALQLDDDDALSGGGNPGGPGDDDVSVPLGGTLSGSGGDGDLDYYFAASQTAPAGFTYNVTTGATTQTLEITQTSTGLIVATITLTNETGVYTVVQNNPVSHPSQDGVLGLDNTENNTPNFNIAFVARDIDTDPSNVVNLVLNIDDDTPVLSNVASGVGVTIDETSAVSISGFPIVAVGASAAITATQAFGADGAAAANSVVYGLSIVGDSPELTTLRTAVGDNLITLVQIDANTIQGQYSGSTVAFQIDIGTDGKLTLTQYVPLEHTTDGSSASAHDDTLNLSGFVNATITITDKDGDSTTASAPIGNQIVFHDDGPDAQLSGQSAGTVTLDETRPEGSDRAGAAPTGTDSETIDFKTAFVTGGSVDYGADGPGTVAYSLVLTGTNVPSGLYALQGTDISLAGVDGDGYGQGDQIVLNQTSTNTITGSVNGTDYFTLTINPTTGVVTFTQLANIWHPTPGTSSFDETATLNTAAASDIKVIQTVTDSDGDFDTAEVNVGRGVFNIQDDGPQAIQPQEATVEDTAGEQATGVPLDDDGSLVGDFGTDLPGRVTFANITPDGMPTSETAGGATIELWLSADGQTLQGRTGSTNGTDGNLIYTVQINSNGTYDFNLVDEIDNGSGSTFANLSGGVAGNPPFKLIQSSSADTLELLATPINGGSINSDTDDMGVDSQFVDTTDGADKGVRLDFGDFTYETNSGGTSDDAFIMVNHSTINGFRFAIDQVSNGTTADVRLKALDADEDGGLEEQAPDPTGDVVDPITMVKIYSVAEVSGVIVYTLVGTYTANGSIGATGATITFEGGGTVLIDDLPAGYAIQTYTADGYDRIEITNPGNNDSGDTDGKYSLSLFSIETTDQGDPIDLYFDVAITDADGDSVVVTDAIHVNVDPAGSSSLAAALPMVVSQEALTDSSELLLMASTVDQQRTMSAANNNSVLLGAIAAAGLGSSVAAAAHDTTLAGHDVVFQAKSISDGFGLRQGASVDDDGGSRSALVGESREALVDQLELSSSSQHNAVAAVQSLTGNDSHPAQVVTELLQGTEALQLSAPQQSSFTSGAVGMPSAEMLATVSANAIAIDAQSRHTGEVGRVLADALAGGGHGPNIDAVIDAVTNQGHPVKAGIEALASQGPAGVSGWDMSAFAGFQGPHSAIMMEHVMVLHPDAVQPAA
jgi:VCBS repeat-containing protein